MIKKSEVKNNYKALNESKAIIESDGVKFVKKQIVYGYWDCKHILDEMTLKGLVDDLYQNQISEQGSLKEPLWIESDYNELISNEDISSYFEESKISIEESKLKDVESIVESNESNQYKYKAIFDNNGGKGLIKEVGLLKDKKEIKTKK